MRSAIVATVFLVFPAGCGVARATDGGVPGPTSTPDPSHELRSAYLIVGGEWIDGETLEQNLEAAREEEAAAAKMAAVTELGASDQFMRSPPPQMADAAGNLRNNRAYMRKRKRTPASRYR